MIRHWTTLQRLSEELSEILADATLISAWSQAKDTAHFEFEKNGEQITLEALLQSDIGTILVNGDIHRARRNTVTLFPNVTGERVAMVTRQLEDRIITIWLETSQLHFELFPAGSSNVILTRDGVVADALRDRQKRVGQHFSSHARAPKVPETTATIRDYIEQKVPSLGRLYALEIIYQKGLRPDDAAASVSTDVLEDLQRAAQDVLAQALAAKTWLILASGNHVALSAIPLHGYCILEQHSSILTSIRRTIALRQQRKQLEDARTAARQAIQRRLHKAERTLLHLQVDEERDSRALTYRHWAELLMAQPQPKLNGVETLEVADWLTNASMSIPLKKDLSILENAARYFQKAKDADTAAKVRASRVPRLQQEQERLRSSLEKILRATTIDELRPYAPSMKQNVNTQLPVSPEEKYRVFRIDDKHTLYVGKSAANNDELTMKFARQQDWWLHVRGASGSHAVLRGVSEAKIPKEVLEKSASITAYYSHARNAGFVPVVYTQRKHVRKPKGANVGAVTIEREQTIMVKPGLPAEFRSIE